MNYFFLCLLVLRWILMLYNSLYHVDLDQCMSQLSSHGSSFKTMVSYRWLNSCHIYPNLYIYIYISMSVRISLYAFHETICLNLQHFSVKKIPKILDSRYISIKGCGWKLIRNARARSGHIISMMKIMFVIEYIIFQCSIIQHAYASYFDNIGEMKWWRAV